MAKIRVLHITPLLAVGGAEKKLFYLLTGLNKASFSHHLIYAVPGDFNEGIEQAGIPLTRIFPMSLLQPASLLSIWRIYRYIKKNKIDLVHCHLDIAYLIGGIAAIMARVPLLFSFQNIADEKHLGYYRVFKCLEKALSPWTDKILVESAEVRDVLLAWRIGAEKLALVPNGVNVPDDLQEIREKGIALRARLGLNDALLVGNMARLVDFKNHRLLLHAAVRVVRQKPEVRFLVIGDGPLRGELEDLSRELGIENQVLFVGTVMDFEPYLAACDLFVLSSHTESTPMALLHALASRLPVISTAVGDIPAIINDGVDGVLVPADDAEAMAGAILGLIADQAKRDAIAAAGWETAKRKFSREAMLSGTEEVYRAVLSVKRES